jgi:hypothetical protein
MAKMLIEVEARVYEYTSKGKLNLNGGKIEKGTVLKYSSQEKTLLVNGKKIKVIPFRFIKQGRTFFLLKSELGSEFNQTMSDVHLKDKDRPQQRMD